MGLEDRTKDRREVPSPHTVRRKVRHVLCSSRCHEKPQSPGCGCCTWFPGFKPDLCFAETDGL